MLQCCQEVLIVKLFKVKEIAEILGRSEGSVRNSITRGQIKAIKVLGSTRITQEELERITGLKYKEVEKNV